MKDYNQDGEAFLAKFHDFLKYSPSRRGNNVFA